MAVNIVSGRGRIMNGEVSNHPLGNKLLLAIVPDHLWVLLWRDFFGQSQHEAPGQLGIPLLFGCLHRVPEGFPVSVFRRSVRWQHDFRVQDAAFAGVIFGFLVVFRKQLLAALVGGTGHRRLALAALGDRDLKMRARNRYHLQNKNRPSGLLLTNGLESYSVVRSLHWDGAGCASFLGESCKKIAAKQRKENAVFLGMETGGRTERQPGFIKPSARPQLHRNGV